MALVKTTYDRQTCDRWVTQRSEQATSKYSSVSFNDYFINELLLTSYGFKNDTKKDSYFIFLSIQ